MECPNDEKFVLLSNSIETFLPHSHFNCVWLTVLCTTSDVININGYAAILRKVVGKSAHDNPERYCRWFWVHCSSKKFERIAWDAIDVCLQVLKKSHKSRLGSCSIRDHVLIISHITFRDCCVHIFSDNLSQNSCRQLDTYLVLG